MLIYNYTRLCPPITSAAKPINRSGISRDVDLARSVLFGHYLCQAVCRQVTRLISVMTTCLKGDLSGRPLVGKVTCRKGDLSLVGKVTCRQGDLSCLVGKVTRPTGVTCPKGHLS